MPSLLVIIMLLFTCGRKENLVKHHKVSKNYDHNYREINPLQVSDDATDKYISKWIKKSCLE